MTELAKRLIVVEKGGEMFFEFANQMFNVKSVARIVQFQGDDVKVYLSGTQTYELARLLPRSGKGAK